MLSVIDPLARCATLALGLALLPAASCAQDDRSARAGAILDHILEVDGGPGVMAAVMQDGELLWSGAVGLADMEAGVSLTPHTRMRIGSLSKPFTAALVLRLVELGRMDVDMDVRGLVPELTTPVSGTITPRLIAAHLSGIRHYNFEDYLEANNVFFHGALEDAVVPQAGFDLISAPGEEHHYTSIGYNVLGLAAERAAEQEFGHALLTYVAQPLGLGDTMIDHPLEIIPNRTRFYTRFPDGVTRNTIWRDSSDFYPSGGLLSSAEDLVTLASAVFGGDWLSDASMDLVQVEARTIAAEGVGYTFGWQVHYSEDGSVDWYGHGGETNGAYAIVRYYPADHLAVAAITNANHAAGEPAFFDAITGDLAGVFRQ